MSERICERCELGGKAREISGPLCHRRHIERLGKGIASALPFIIHKEKCLVPQDRSAQCSPELIFTERCGHSGSSEKISGVKNIIAQEFIDAAMESIASGFGNDVDHGAGFSAKLGVVIRF